MKSREYKYLKADRYFTFFGAIVWANNKHWQMRKRLSKMTTDQYIRWKNRQ